MAVTSQTYNGDGSTTQFVFTVPYLDISDIKATIGGAETTAFTAAGSPGALTVTFNAAPTSGTNNVEIRRETNNDQIQSNFQSGSALRASDFNNNFTQFQYVTQESANVSNLALSLAREGDAIVGFKSAIDVANEAKNTANAASSVIGQAVPYIPIGSVGGIPSFPTDGQRIEINDSTSIENFTPLNGMPFGFEGSNQLIVRLQYIAANGAWDFQSYAVADQDARYIIKSGPAGQDGQYLVTDSNGDAVWRSFVNATQLADGLMANTDKTKLDGIETGAEVNVNADWNATAGDAWILNRPQLSLVATTGRYSDLTGAPTIPVNTSQLTNDQQFLEPTNSLNIDFSGTNTFSGNVTLNKTVELRPTTGSPAQISFYCENTSNPHAVVLKAPPHSAQATYTIEFPYSLGANGQVLTTNGQGGTLWTTPFDGVYTSLSSLPTISTVGGTGEWTDILNKPSFATVATSGNASDLNYTGFSVPNATNATNAGHATTAGAAATATTATYAGHAITADAAAAATSATTATSATSADSATTSTNVDIGNATGSSYFQVALLTGTSGSVGVKRDGSLTWRADQNKLYTYNISCEDIECNSVTADNDITAFSDARLKTNVQVIDHALDKVQSINGVTFNRTDLNLGRKQTGLIAQELQKVLPEAVIETSDGTLAVAYGNVVGLLVEAIKELKSEIEVLKNATS